jgi:hypothetical protein
LIQIRVSAYNSLGFGVPSLLNIEGVTVIDTPHQPLTSPLRNEGSSPYQLVVHYPNLEDELNGGSEVTSLHLQWDMGTSGSEWQTLIGEVPFTTSDTYTINGGLITGQSYQFQYRAKNVFGWGEWSDSAYVLAASLPDTSSPVVTTLEGSNVKLSWSANTLENGSTITEYLINIITSEETFVEDELCNGADLETVNSKTCTIPMEMFT